MDTTDEDGLGIDLRDHGRSLQRQTRVPIDDKGTGAASIIRTSSGRNGSSSRSRASIDSAGCSRRNGSPPYGY